jgi:protein TonB
MTSRAGSCLLIVAALVACGDQGEHARPVVAGRPDEPPVMVNPQPPFHYPAALYARRVQGNVTLRLFVDADGRAVSDSTRVAETSGHPSLDSAAIDGARSLRFVPAKKGGDPVAAEVLFPVFFRHPEAAPLPGDSILQGDGRRRGT